MSRIRAALAALTLACALAAPSLASAAPEVDAVFPRRRAVPVRRRQGAAGLRRPARQEDQDRHDAASGHGPGAPHRLAVREPGRAGRARRGVPPRGRPAALHARGAGALRPGRVRPPRRRPQQPAALLQLVQPDRTSAAERPVSDDARRAAGVGGGRSLPRREVRREGRTDRLAHGHRRRGPRHGPPARGRRRCRSDLRRPVLRLVPRRDLREPLPDPRPCPHRGRRPQPGRVGHRHAGRRRPAVLDPGRQPARLPGDARRVLPPVRRRGRRLRLRTGLGGALRAPSPRGCRPVPSPSRTRTAARPRTATRT